MNQSKKESYRRQAETIIKKLQLRKMQGHYCDTMEEACDLVMSLIGEGCKNVAYGGSMTIDESDLKEKIQAAGHNLIVRENYRSEEELRELKALTVNADSFLTSTNAITLNGELINIDARGNRVSFLIYGPDQVIVLVGMNKVVANVEDGIRRVKTAATPPNAVRLQRDTPCAKTGVCANCLQNSLCCHTVITRDSVYENRIKVILIGEELGY